ncbi:uncharacterized protein isoform X2 [Danio rerio]|uniref:Uncharacterized protein isoform X2 n=1 Tax=Danio rerio TaxID=7955 RepID=A0AC58HZ15_DANRE
MIHTLILTGVLLHIGDGAWIDKLNIGVKSGSPGIIPCQYEKQYQENHKYWCQGTLWISCTILAFGNGPKSKFSITYYPAQSIFTVEWQNLQPSDSGYYWCAVEIGGSGTLDAGYYVYLTVQSAPNVFVMSSSVSGHEGDDVRVQCFYSSGYKAKNKQWCRVKDKKCFYPKKKTDTSQNSSVQISDDDLQVPVQLTVTKPRPKVLTTTPTTPKTERSTTQPSANTAPTKLHAIINTPTATGSRPKSHVEDPHRSPTADSEHNAGKDIDEQNKYDVILIICLVTTLTILLLVALFAIVICRMRKNPENEQIREERFNSNTINTMPSENQMTSISPEKADSSADDASVVYSIVSFTKTRLSSVDPEADVIYSTVMKDRKTE